MKAKCIFEYLEQYFPLGLQEPWDCCGIQIGSEQQEVTRIMVALDASLETLEEAIAHQVDLLVTHHPLLLEKVSTLKEETAIGQFIKKAMEHHIVVYSLHTCLDRGSQFEGMNYLLMNALNVKGVVHYDEEKMGLKGYFDQPKTLSSLIQQLYETFHVEMIRSAGYKSSLKQIAILAGSGSDDLEKLVGQVDVFITGDSKYRHAKYDLVLIDVGHHLEVVMVENIIRLLKPLDVEVLPATSKDFYQYWRSL